MKIDKRKKGSEDGKQLRKIDKTVWKVEGTESSNSVNEI